ncbi:MAG: CPBP family intramembrane metalloprotease [Myxococcales bacterium]|nr:CPBP family intramembrane metalloprotease [Myxococcales bacterium]
MQPDDRWIWTDLALAISVTVLVLALGALAVGAVLGGRSPLVLTLGLAAVEAVAILLGVGVAWMRRAPEPPALGLRGVSPRTLVGAVAVGMACMPLVGFVALGVRVLLGGPVDNPQLAAFGDAQMTPGLLALMVLLVGLIVPVAEELLFRGLVLDFLRQRYGAGPAILGSSVAFGLVHFEPSIAVGTGVLGVVMGVARLKTGSLWPAVVIHATNNTLSAFAMYLTL